MLAVAWDLAVFASGYAEQYFPTWSWSSVWLLGVLVLIFIPLVRGTARWTALGAGILGIVGVIADVSAPVLFVLPLSAAYGPALSMIFKALFAIFGFRAYVEKPPA